jgi:hypothetical protein
VSQVGCETLADLALSGKLPSGRRKERYVKLRTNQHGYNLFRADYSVLSCGICFCTDVYLTLQDAYTTSGCSLDNWIYWDENGSIGCSEDDGHGEGCPSTAYENSLGSIPSEAVTIIGTACRECGYTPEPSSILLFGSGILGLAGVLRRRLNIWSYCATTVSC